MTRSPLAPLLDQTVKTSFMQNKLAETWHYRSYVTTCIRREIQARYLNSVLGAAWIVILPITTIAVYTLIFSQIIGAKLPGVDSSFGYSIYLCSGILTWGFFAEMTSRGQVVFIENGNLLKKMRFPWLCLPAINVGTALVNFGVVFSLFLLFLLLSGNFPGLIVLAAIPVLIVHLAFAMGVALVLAVLNVFFRDVGHLFGVVLQFWFWMTPIVYPVSILPEVAQRLMLLNPMAGLIGAYQTIFVLGEAPNWLRLAPISALAVLLCWFGLHTFGKHAQEMADEL